MNAPAPPSKTQADKAGQVIRRLARTGDIDPFELRKALDLIAAFRARWVQPPRALTKVDAGLRSMAETVAGGEARVSQRLKRLHRIAEKLVRADFRGRLSQMEDIGGCRAVVQSLDHLLRLRDRVTARWAATMRAESARDYVASPKADGYRAVHLVVERDGLLVEVQLRTHRQHLWATNVERLEARVGRPLRGGHASERMGEALRGLSEALAMLDRGLPVPATYREHMAQWLAVLDPKA